MNPHKVLIDAIRNLRSVMGDSVSLDEMEQRALAREALTSDAHGAKAETIKPSFKF